MLKILLASASLAAGPRFTVFHFYVFMKPLLQQARNHQLTTMRKTSPKTLSTVEIRRARLRESIYFLFHSVLLQKNREDSSPNISLMVVLYTLNNCSQAWKARLGGKCIFAEKT